LLQETLGFLLNDEKSWRWGWSLFLQGDEDLFLLKFSAVNRLIDSTR